MPQQPDGVGRSLMRTVVGTAIVREGRVLAARGRTPGGGGHKRLGGVSAP
jgi:hypothetical protein